MADTYLFYRKEFQLGLAIATAALIIALVALLSQHRVELKLSTDYNRYSCEVSNPQTSDHFKILTLTGIGAIELADSLCGAPGMGSLAAEVNIYWQPRGYLSAQHIVDQHFDLIWNRRHVAYGLVPNLEDYYDPLLDSPQYRLYFISHAPNPELSDVWLGR